MNDLAHVYARLASIGARFTPDVLQETRALYRPLLEGAARAGRDAITDIPYGDDERHRLDIYPADGAERPILLFVHGGGFVGGDKAGDPLFYSNVGRYFSAAGFCTVVVNYRLAPRHTWPAGGADIGAAIAWIAASIRDYGGDPQRLHVLGQSAGASHVASYLFDPTIERKSGVNITAAALMSGFYQASPPLEGGPALYFGPDESLWPMRSPAAHVAAGHPRLLLSVAQFDPAVIADQTLILARALNRADGAPPRLVWFERENHVSTVHGLGLGDDQVGRTLRAFFAAN